MANVATKEGRQVLMHETCPDETAVSKPIWDR